MIPHNRPTLSLSDSDVIAKVIASGYIAQGQQVSSFESAMTDYVGLKYGCALSSGTASLYVALKVAGVTKGDKVIIPTYVCSALLNAIFMLGATPVLMDVDRNNYNIVWSEVIETIDERTRAIIVPHIHGVPTYIEKSLLPQSVTLIEDCATAVNSYVSYEGHRKHVGNIGDMAVFSFYATKYFTTGQGGMVCTNNEALYKRLIDYRDFDCCEQYEPRFNFQMTDMQAAMGIAQMEHFADFDKKRKQIASVYKELCACKGWRYQGCEREGKQYMPFANNYRFIIELSNKECRELLMNQLEINGIKTIVPIERYELLHNYLHMEAIQFANAEQIVDVTLSLPIYPALSETELDKILTILKNY